MITRTTHDVDGIALEVLLGPAGANILRPCKSFPSRATALAEIARILKGN
jgi:hypothetical protein